MAGPMLKTYNENHATAANAYTATLDGSEDLRRRERTISRTDSVAKIMPNSKMATWG
jgi:hypothetical protein